jgi:trimeric autotransporter adhesin
VASARLGTTALAIAAQTATSLGLDVPAGASTAFLTLVDTGGTARQSSQQVTIVGPVSVASFSPASLLTGASLTIAGSGLDRASSVEFAGGATAAIASRSGSTSITVTVPSTAITGPVTVVSSTGERAASSAALTVIPRITVTNPSTLNVAAGSTVTLSGTGFTEVTGVLVGTTTATMGPRNATELSFAVPAGVACGSISLLSASQPTVFGGAVVAGSGCAMRVESIEFAQLMSQTVSDTRQRLVPGRETWVRAYVLATTSNVPAPAVRLTAFNGSTVLGTVAMSGPVTVPVLAPGSPLPDSMRYSTAQSYNARLNDAWVGSGLRVEVTVDPDQQVGTAIMASATPAMGTRTRIDLVLVPLVSGTNAPSVPSSAINEALDEMTRRMPVARSDITVSIRQPYTLTSVTDGVDTSSEWSSALSELEQLRRREALSKHYYGLVRPMVSAGIAGIGYVNRVGSSSPNLASMGWDTSRSSWLRTFTHELGHNFSRSHAPCGSVSSSDPNYPYTGGALGSTPLFDVLNDVVVSPVGSSGSMLTDVMGYCSGRWFSDYSLREVQRFLEASPQAALSVQAQAATGGAKSGGDVLVVSGVIRLDGVQLAPVQMRRGAVQATEEGDYELRLRTADGRIFAVPFDAVLVDHAMPPERHFHVEVPDPGPLAAVELARAGSVFVSQSAAPMSDAVRTAAAARLQVATVGGDLQLTWDAARHPFASVTHVADSAAGADEERTVLVLNARGGRVALDAASLPAGGRFEVSLSDGINAQLRSIPR